MTDQSKKKIQVVDSTQLGKYCDDDDYDDEYIQNKMQALPALVKAQTRDVIKIVIEAIKIANKINPYNVGETTTSKLVENQIYVYKDSQNGNGED